MSGVEIEHIKAYNGVYPKMTNLQNNCNAIL